MNVWHRTVLVVDDVEMNRELLVEHLSSAGYETMEAPDGARALDLLAGREVPFSAVLLDKMMPGLDGLDVLREIKGDPVHGETPVIMQTAATASQDMLDGLRSGAYYYLTKPFEPDVLLAITAAAISDHERTRALCDDTRRRADAVGLIISGRFRFRTLEEARNLATMLALACPDPETAVVGLMELFVNAVEHGNLGISYREKSRLTLEDRWAEEVARRLALPENAGKSVDVRFERTPNDIEIAIRDDGPGFDWRPFVDFDPARAGDVHGRGIAMARSVSFATLDYLGRGNRVVATIALDGKAAPGNR